MAGNGPGNVGKRALVVVLSAILAGGFPVAALAETADEFDAPTGDEQALVEGERIVDDNLGASEETIVEIEGDPEDDLDHELDTAADEDGVVEDDDSEDDRNDDSDTEDEVDKVKEVSALRVFGEGVGEDDSEDADPIEVVELRLGQEVAASASKGSYWVGKFTASEDGAYQFESSGDADTYGELYEDEGLNDRLGYDDDDGDGSNFRIRRELSAGDTVYLRVSECGDGSFSCDVSVTKLDATDLSNGYVYAYDVEYAIAMVFPFDVCDYKDYTLDANAYDLVFYQESWSDDDGDPYEELSGAPTTPGTFYVAARAKDGSGYKGETPKERFCIYNLLSLDDCYMSLDSYYIYSEGMALPVPTVYDYKDNVVPDSCYDRDYYDSTDKKVEAADLKAGGEYYVRATGKGQYSGSCQRWFSIADAKDLKYGSLKVGYGGLVDYKVDMDLPLPTVYDGNGEVVPEAEYYDPEYYVVDDDDDYEYGDDDDYEYDENDRVTSAKGLEVGRDYRIVVKAKEGSKYSGSTSGVFRLVENSHDITNWRWRGSSYVDYFGGTFAPEIRIYREDAALVEGKDYAVDYVEDFAGNRVERPSESGTYVVWCEGKYPYTGHLGCGVYVNMADLTVDAIPAQTYTGKAITPALVAKAGARTLKAGTDYTLSYKNNVNAGTATVTITGKGDYTGTKDVTFRIAKAQQSVTASDKTVAAGKTISLDAKASGGGKLTFSSSNPSVATVSPAGVVTGKGAGKATITIAAAATGNYEAATKTVTVTVTKAATPAVAAKAKQSVTASDRTVAVGNTVSLDARASGGGKLAFSSSNPSVATVSSTGVVTGKAAGKATITIAAAATGNYEAATKTVTVTVTKAANPMTAKATKKTVKKAKVKKKKQTVKAITVSNAQGKVTYKVAKWGNKKAKKYLKLNAKTGKVTVKKGTPKGTYKAKVKVTAAGNASYEATTKTVTVKVVVK